MEIVVVGAGFAGVWAAAGAVRTAAELGREEDVTVTVVAPGEDMVIRPRLYEDDPSRMRVALDRVLGPIGVRRVRAEITGVDVDAHRVTGRDHDGNPVELAYDKLVLATGSTLVSPQLPGAEHLFDVDTIEAADALHQHIAQLSQDPQRPGAFAAVVVGGGGGGGGAGGGGGGGGGGGFTGLEVATELPSRLRAVAGEHPVRVVMLDRADVVGRALGDGPRPEIEAALEAEGVEVRLGTGMESLTEDSARLTDGTVIEAATVIWTAGMRAQVLTEQIPGERDDLGRLVVDEQLQRPVSSPQAGTARSSCAGRRASSRSARSTRTGSTRRSMTARPSSSWRITGRPGRSTETFSRRPPAQRLADGGQRRCGAAPARLGSAVRGPSTAAQMLPSHRGEVLQGQPGGADLGAVAQGGARPEALLGG
ncbi:NAD(P)/FAD-dependent oxidoreductase, partial [Kocuria sp. CPCC 205295]|uniref:NAD(P)/FAD-dependent oxidoreductase n=1 Tax=Kocuria sp. CPCC 205295 TaxID=3073557 RepID=UPI0036D96CA0